MSPIMHGVALYSYLVEPLNWLEFITTHKNNFYQLLKTMVGFVKPSIKFMVLVETTFNTFFLEIIHLDIGMVDLWIMMQFSYINS